LEIQEELSKGIKNQEEKIRLITQKDDISQLYNTEPLRAADVNRVAKAYYQKDNRWYHSVLL